MIERHAPRAASRARQLSAADRFGKGDDAHASSLQIREIADANGKLVYESFTWLGDDGCIFRAGTTNEVASVVQERVECDDAALEGALQEAMTSRQTMSAATLWTRESCGRLQSRWNYGPSWIRAWRS